MSSSSDVILWPKLEPFTIGALPIPPNTKLTIYTIKKIVPYVKTKCKNNFPNISFSIWKHIACKKLLLTENIARAYFMTCDVLLNKHADEKLHWQSVLSQAFTNNALEPAEGLLTLPSYKFVLYLYIQHLHKISLRASLVSGSDEWPSKSKSQDLDRSLVGSKSLDENSHATFLLNNLTEILELLADNQSESDSGASMNAQKNAQISLDKVEALGFLISGCVETYKNIWPLAELSLANAVENGYNKNTKSFLLRSFEGWLKSRLISNPYSVGACIDGGKQLCWPLAGETKAEWAKNRRGKIITNAVFVPKEHFKGNKVIVLTQTSQMTIARDSITLHEATVRIQKCHGSFIYLLSPLRSLLIEKCQRCTVVVGSVETSLDVVRCENLTVIAATHRFSTLSCQLCIYHLLVPTQPLVYSGNEGIVFAPYNTHYPKLDEHMAAVGLSAEYNLWNQPLYLGPEADDTSMMFGIMKPVDLSTFIVPFKMDGPTNKNAYILPARYQKALNQRCQHIQSLQNLVIDYKLDRHQKKKFHDIVNARFQEWLQRTGNYRQLEGLTVISE